MCVRWLSTINELFESIYTRMCKREEIDPSFKFTVGVFGEFQYGKSTFINCLLNRNIAKTGGAGVRVTSYNTLYTYSSSEYVVVP